MVRLGFNNVRLGFWCRGSYGIWCEEGKDWIKTVWAELKCKISDSKLKVFVMTQRRSLTIQERNGACILSSLPLGKGLQFLYLKYL